MEYKTQFIHREDRRIARQALFGKHGFKAYISVDGATYRAELTDFSSLGFAISLKNSEAENLNVGGRIQVSVSPLIHQNYVIKGLVIDKQDNNQGKTKISAVIEHEQSSKHTPYHPIHLNAEQSLKGQIVHPFVYKQNSYFEVESLSRNGFYAIGIQSEFTLFEGMDVEYSLASITGLQLATGRVSNVSLTESNKVRCFIEMTSLPFQTEDELSQHCFHFAQKTPRDITRAGLSAQHIQTLVQYRFVETQAEYEAVLKLRRKAYASKGFCAKDTPITTFAMQQDSYGRILIVFHNERVIGSALLVFGEQVEKPFELEELLSSDVFSQLPDYDTLMEITGICIERYYQDTDVLHGVFEAMYREGLSAGKQYVMVASEDENVSRYKKMGFKSEDISLQHAMSDQVKLNVLILNEETGKTGKGMNPIAWWDVWGPVSQHLYQRRIIEYSLLQKMRVQLNKAIFSVNSSVKNVARWLNIG